MSKINVNTGVNVEPNTIQAKDKFNKVYIDVDGNNVSDEEDVLSPTSRQILDEEENIYIITRTGKRELMDTNQIVNRIKGVARRHPRIRHINAYDIMKEVTFDINSNITTYEIDEYVSNKLASLGVENPHCLTLAGRLAIDNHQKNTKRSFIDKMKDAYLFKDEKNEASPLINSKFYKFVEKHQDIIEPMIDYKRDFLLDLFGFRTFQRVYGLRVSENNVIERPQDMFMRAAIALFMCDDADETTFEKIKNMYDLLSCKNYTHASPTYFNSGTNRQQLSSCFLLGTEDSLEGIKSTDLDMAKISKYSGGIGVHIHKWRSSGAMIRGTNGRSSGPVPFLRGYETTMLSFNQGGKRMGSAAVYYMPHHPNAIEITRLRRPDGSHEERARKLFYAVWIPDIFMQRVKDGDDWSMFDPDICGSLSSLYDEEGDKKYTKRYLELEQAGKAKKVIKARLLWEEIFKTNKLTGLPYICFSDNVNRQSNQKNIGTIESSNLCAEICEYSSSTETAVCNLCSLNLTSIVKDVYNSEELQLPNNKRRALNNEFPLNPRIDFSKLSNIAQVAVRNLNNVIDRTFYPTEKTYRSNMRHRPIGVGVQGLADLYIKMRYPYDSDNAKQLNKKIFETILYGCYTESTRMARDIWKNAVKECKEKGSYTHTVYKQPLCTKMKPDEFSKLINSGAYEEKWDYEEEKVVYTDYRKIPKTIGAYASMTWNGGSPIWNGKFCWELAGLETKDLSGRWDWETLRGHIQTFGMRNSLCVAIMPTATTAQLLGNNECIEPYTSNIYKRKTLVGENIVINKYLVKDLYDLGIWDANFKDYLLNAEGSIQGMKDIPSEIRELYKTSWEIDPEVLIEHAIGRQPFIDQSQSLNLYMENLTMAKFTKLMFKAWKGNLKTGKYYFHTRPSAMADKVTTDASKQAETYTIKPNQQIEIHEIMAKKKRARESFMDPLRNVCNLCGA